MTQVQLRCSSQRVYFGGAPDTAQRSDTLVRAAGFLSTRPSTFSHQRTRQLHLTAHIWRRGTRLHSACVHSKWRERIATRLLFSRGAFVKAPHCQSAGARRLPSYATLSADIGYVLSATEHFLPPETRKAAGTPLPPTSRRAWVNLSRRLKP